MEGSNVGAGILILKLLIPVVPLLAGAAALLTVMVEGGTVIPMFGPTEEVAAAAPLTLRVVAADAGIETVLLDGPTVSTPVEELKFTVGVMFTVLPSLMLSSPLL